MLITFPGEHQRGIEDNSQSVIIMEIVYLTYCKDCILNHLLTVHVAQLSGDSASVTFCPFRLHKESGEFEINGGFLSVSLQDVQVGVEQRDTGDNQ